MSELASIFKESTKICRYHVTQVANCILVVTLRYCRMTAIYGNGIFLKIPNNLISLLTADLFFKWVFAHGIVSLGVLAFLTINHPFPFIDFPQENLLFSQEN